MAVTKLTDIVEPAIWLPYVQLASTEKSGLWKSGIVVTDAQVSNLAKSGGRTVSMPFFNDLGSPDSNIGDDSDNDATPNAITAAKDVAVLHVRNQAFGAKDIAAAVAGKDPMMAIALMFGNYWAREFQKLLIYSINGAIADNVANFSGDMLKSIATDSADPITPAELISAEAVIDASQTMGDRSNEVTAMAMHSAPYSRLQKLNLIDFREDSDAKIKIPYYLDKRVIVDDGMPAVAGANRITYTTALFAPGAFGFGEGSPRMPVETERKALSGKGEGQEVLVHRRHFILHPRGIAFDGTPAGTSPTKTELEAAANWTRVYERKLIRMAFLKTNG